MKFQIPRLILLFSSILLLLSFTREISANNSINLRQLALLPTKIKNDAKGSWNIIIPWKGNGIEQNGMP